MARRLMTAGALVGGLIAAGLAAAGVGRTAWRRGTARAVRQLREGIFSEGAAVDPKLARKELEGLPRPVARYFGFALMEDQPVIVTARIRWSGEFQSRPAGGWAPFTAAQHFTTRPPGFVWDARIRLLPFVAVRVRDGYHLGRGTMLGRIGGLVPVVAEGGTPEMAQSALARWLGESVWFPTALLPGGPVHWEAIDDNTARATVSDGSVRTSAEFRFAPTGEISRMTAMRHRDVGGTPVLTAFEGRYGRYEQRNGVMVPAEAEVAWKLPDGDFPYWRGRPESIEYESAAAADEPMRIRH